MPVADLGAIYSLADVDHDGRLTQPEFYVAMKLVANRRAGAEIPATLPYDLLAGVGLQQYTQQSGQPQHMPQAAPPSAVQAPPAPHSAAQAPPAQALVPMGGQGVIRPETDSVMEERVKELEEALMKKERENKALRSEKGALESRFRQVRLLVTIPSR